MKQERSHDLPRLNLTDVVDAARETLLEVGRHDLTLIVEGRHQMLAAQLSRIENSAQGSIRQFFAAGVALGQNDELGALQQVFFVGSMQTSANDLADGSELPARVGLNPREVLMISQYQVPSNESAMVVFETHRDQYGTVVDVSETDRVDAKWFQSSLLSAFASGFALGEAQRQMDRHWQSSHQRTLRRIILFEQVHAHRRQIGISLDPYAATSHNQRLRGLKGVWRALFSGNGG